VLPIPVDICNGSTESFGASANPKPRAHTQILVVSCGPKAGRFLGYVGHELIVSSRQPVLDGARELLMRGYDPGTPYNMRHANSAMLSFITTTIGHAAGLGVNDTRATASRNSSGRDADLDHARQASTAIREGIRS
jgi:hypothetical protein